MGPMGGAECGKFEKIHNSRVSEISGHGQSRHTRPILCGFRARIRQNCPAEEPPLPRHKLRLLLLYGSITTAIKSPVTGVPGVKPRPCTRLSCIRVFDAPKQSLIGILAPVYSKRKEHSRAGTTIAIFPA